MSGACKRPCSASVPAAQRLPPVWCRLCSSIVAAIRYITVPLHCYCAALGQRLKGLSAVGCISKTLQRCVTFSLGLSTRMVEAVLLMLAAAAAAARCMSKTLQPCCASGRGASICTMGAGQRVLDRLGPRNLVQGAQTLLQAHKVQVVVRSSRPRSCRRYRSEATG